MASLLDLPPELLVNILSSLPIRTLLRFSETCHFSHSLARSCLHTLSLGLHTTRVAAIISDLSATQYPQPKHIGSLFSSSINPSTTSTKFHGPRQYGDEHKSLFEESLDRDDPYKVSVMIPDAQAFDPRTLLVFHTALTKSILGRHGATLRNLELSLWTLTIPIAKELSSLSALRAVSIRIEAFPQIRGMSRRLVTEQRTEQRKAWGILTDTATWAPRLHALRIEGGELSSDQLFTLLRRSRWCRELWLCRCPLIGKELWNFLGSEWEEGRTALRILGVMRCGGQLNEEVLDLIGGLSSLQFLTLSGCHGLDSETVEKRNAEVWRIPECIPPVPPAAIGNARTVIEVDPLYMQDEL